MKQRLDGVSIYRYAVSLNESNNYYSKWKQQLIVKWGLPTSNDKEIVVGSTKQIYTAWELSKGGTITLSQGVTKENGETKLVTVVALKPGR